MSLILLPKGNNRQHEHLANAEKIKNKMHQLSPKRQTGCPEKDIVLQLHSVILDIKKNRCSNFECSTRIKHLGINASNF